MRRTDSHAWRAAEECRQKLDPVGEQAYQKLQEKIEQAELQARIEWRRQLLRAITTQPSLALAMLTVRIAGKIHQWAVTRIEQHNDAEFERGFASKASARAKSKPCLSKT